ncbi:hypothetical protein OSTOST_14132, partial [Ostertagia ostertagi]
QLKPDKFEEVSQQINFLLLLVNRFAEAKLSPMEFAYLKLVSIPTSTCASDTRPLNVTACQELYEHVMASSSNDDSTSEDNETHVLPITTAAAESAMVPRIGARRAVLFRSNREPFNRDGDPVRVEDGCDERIRAIPRLLTPSPSASLARILSGN